MTAVTRVLPRHWDGRRLLRFLTGLAMLALAFTVHMTPPAPSPPSLPAALPAAAPAALPAAAPASSTVTPPSSTVTEEPVASLPALPIETPLAISSAVVLPLVAGFALRVRAERAPPLA
ncbi:MAG TPA: hypothetical protein VGD29_17685 [Actinoplanes sp.]